VGIDEASSPAPIMWTPPTVTSWPSLVSSQLPPVAAARSTMTEPGRIRATIAARYEHRCAPPGHRGSGYHDVRSANVGGDHFLLAGQELLGLCGCVTPGAFLGLQGQLDERSPEALYFLLGCRPHVVRADNRAQTARRGNGLKPATPAPITRARAGGTVPAAVMNRGKNLPSLLAAINTAR
jgi:hypothetical protein